MGTRQRPKGLRRVSYARSPWCSGHTCHHRRRTGDVLGGNEKFEQFHVCVDTRRTSVIDECLKLGGLVKREKNFHNLTTVSHRGAREQDLEGIRELITARDVELYPDAFRSCIMRSFMTQSVVFLSALMTSMLLLGFHMATFLCFLAAFEVAIWGGNRLWWIKKHEGLMHELNNWSGFNRIYTAN